MKDIHIENLRKKMANWKNIIFDEVSHAAKRECNP